LEEGQIIKEFMLADGRSVILRMPKNSDLDGLLELINSLVEEKALILVAQKVTREQETDFLRKLLLQLRDHRVFFVVAVLDGRIVASSDLQTKGELAGTVGLVVKSGFRGLGIGTEILKVMSDQAKSVGIKVLAVKVFVTNTPAIRLYSKMGFAESAGSRRRFVRNGESVEELTMIKQTA
jgi:RimJ/RimL family protein N-acetyltransferase